MFVIPAKAGICAVIPSEGEARSEESLVTYSLLFTLYSSMSEIVTTYLLSNPDEPMPMDRGDFYKEQTEAFFNNQLPKRAVEIVQVLLFTPDKDIILEKRARTKNHNPGLIDKAVGGHITFGNSPTYTVVTETIQELEVPSMVLNDKEDFTKTYKLLRSHLTSLALVQYIDTRIQNLPKIIGGKLMPIMDKYHFYLGVFGGSIRPADKEAAGILFYSYDSFQEEIDKYPALFTDELQFFLKRYNKKITEFLAKF